MKWVKKKRSIQLEQDNKQIFILVIYLQAFESPANRVFIKTEFYKYQQNKSTIAKPCLTSLHTRYSGSSKFISESQKLVCCLIKAGVGFP